jgi:hypothetical protein
MNIQSQNLSDPSVYLPAEVFVHSLSFLDPNSLKKCAQVSQNFRASAVSIVASRINAQAREICQQLMKINYKMNQEKLEKRLDENLKSKDFNQLKKNLFLTKGALSSEVHRSIDSRVEEADRLIETIGAPFFSTREITKSFVRQSLEFLKESLKERPKVGAIPLSIPFRGDMLVNQGIAICPDSSAPFKDQRFFSCSDFSSS